MSRKAVLLYTTILFALGTSIATSQSPSEPSMKIVEPFWQTRLDQATGALSSGDLNRIQPAISDIRSYLETLDLKDAQAPSSNPLIVPFFVLEDVATLQRSKGDLEGATITLRHSLELSRKLFREDSVRHVRLLRHLEHLYRLDGKTSDAEKTAADVLRLQEQMIARCSKSFDPCCRIESPHCVQKPGTSGKME